MTKIQWTDESWNPIRGCSRVSLGCVNCYAEKVAGRFCGEGEAYEGLVTIGESGRRSWNGKVKLIEGVVAAPIRWRRPRLIFVNSMSDLFHESIPFETIALLFGVMAVNPEHTFQVLTKRPGRMAEFFDWMEGYGLDAGGRGPGRAMYDALCTEPIPWPSNHVGEEGEGLTDRDELNQWPLPNVWLGVSVENQETADTRIPILNACEAEVRWVSYEPALGPVDFSKVPPPAGHRPINGATFEDIRGALSVWQAAGHLGQPRLQLSHRVDWIVVGGESGPGARRFDIAWARATIAACEAAGIPCFVKQLGTAPRLHSELGRGYHHHDRYLDEDYVLQRRKGDDPDEWPEDLRVRQWPAGFARRGS